MKLYNKLGIATLLLALGLGSCAKENEPIAKEQAPTTKEAKYAGLSMLAGVNYKIGEELGDVIPNEARAVVAETTGDLNSNHDIPTLYVNYSGLKVRWAVYAKSGTSISNISCGDVTTKHTTYQQNTNMGTGFTILNDDGRTSIADNGKGRKIAVTVEGGTGRDFSSGRYAHMVIGGTMRSKDDGELEVSQAFGYNSSDTPNANSRLILATNNSKLTMPFPLTTSIQRIAPQLTIGTTTNEFQDKKVNWVKMTNNFNARGTVLGFRIWNKTGYKIKVKSLEILNHKNLGTPFSTKGYFSPASNNSTLKFVPESNTENNTRSYTLRIGSTDHFDLNNDDKTNGRFYFWGYPVAPTKELYVKVVYQSYNSAGTLQAGDQNSVIQKIAVPGGGSWADGTYYRVNLKVKDPIRNPLEYAAEYCVRADQTGFVDNHNVTANHGSSVGQQQAHEVGYFTHPATVALFENRDFLRDYVFPTKARWTSILSNLKLYFIDEGILASKKFQPVNDNVENVQVGTKNMTITSDYRRSGQTIYARRYKGTPQETAWEYSRGPNNELIIKSVFIKNTTVDQIVSNASTIFSSSKVITRVFPAYGLVEDDRLNTPGTVPSAILYPRQQGFYWREDRENGVKTAHIKFTDKYLERIVNEFSGSAYPLRPFHKDL